jgi:carbamoyl-phosphate synthase large subunit
VVTKIPRFTFEKFPQADDRLSTQMKSVGEVMAIGRNFQESFQKALRGLETGVFGLDPIVDQATDPEELEDLYRTELRLPGAKRIWYVADAFRSGYSLQQIFAQTAIDPWFLVQIEDLVKIEQGLAGRDLESLDAAEFRALKRKGFSDRRLAELLDSDELDLGARRRELGVRPIYKRVDTCAAEFASSTAYLYSSYDEECEARPGDRDKIVVLGGGPNRIGQGIEFDYCCVHAALAMREDGYETIMINCNPETVSTDYDTSDRLYFEPLTYEDVLEVIHLEKPKGVIVQFGGQTPLNLARALEAAGVPIIGTTPDSIDLAEDRERFQKMIQDLGLLQPPNQIAFNVESAADLAEQVGFPLVVRPSYVLGGRAMEIVYDQEDLARYMTEAVKVTKDSPVLLDRFLDEAVEVDVDAICDGEQVLIGGLMEHIEQAGVHSGDSACSLPPYTLSAEMQQRLCDQVGAMAKALGVVGLMNTQFAIKDDEVYILEVNPRASRTVPFVSKATGVPLAKIAARCMVGQSLKQQGRTEQAVPDFISVKESVFPFTKFQGVDPILGPEMKSTGEVMGIGKSFAEAYAKGMMGSGAKIPEPGTAFLSVRETDKKGIVELARELHQQGFKLVATGGTARVIRAAGVECQHVNKVKEGRPHVVDMIKNDEIVLIVNTTEGRSAIADSYAIRREAIMRSICYTTTLSGGRATCQAMSHREIKEVYCLQSLH